jgi:hypothetical protein
VCGDRETEKANKKWKQTSKSFLLYLKIYTLEDFFTLKNCFGSTGV